MAATFLSIWPMAKNRAHIVVAPFPAQGHLSPTVHLLGIKIHCDSSYDAYQQVEGTSLSLVRIPPTGWLLEMEPAALCGFRLLPLEFPSADGVNILVVPR